MGCCKDMSTMCVFDKELPNVKRRSLGISLQLSARAQIFARLPLP